MSAGGGVFFPCCGDAVSAVDIHLARYFGGGTPADKFARDQQGLRKMFLHQRMSCMNRDQRAAFGLPVIEDVHQIMRVMAIDDGEGLIEQ